LLSLQKHKFDMQLTWDLYINLFIAMLSIINPIGIVPMWTELTGDKKIKVRQRVAFLLTLTAVIILLVFLMSGKYLLQFFSIDIPVFKIAGGILLLTAGLSMVSGSATNLKDREEEGDNIFTVAKKRFRKIMVPMVIPRLAGPGSITTVILFGSKGDSMVDYGIMGGVVIVTMFTLFMVFAFSHHIEKRVDSIIFVIFTRLFGIIVTAIALQFMLEGLGEVFPNWMEGVSEIESSGENKKNGD